MIQLYLSDAEVLNDRSMIISILNLFPVVQRPFGRETRQQNDVPFDFFQVALLPGRNEKVLRRGVSFRHPPLVYLSSGETQS